MHNIQALFLCGLAFYFMLGNKHLNLFSDKLNIIKMS